MKNIYKIHINGEFVLNTKAGHIDSTIDWVESQLEGESVTDVYYDDDAGIVHLTVELDD